MAQRSVEEPDAVEGAEASTPAAARELSHRERQALAEFDQRLAGRRPTPNVKVERRDDGVLHLEIDDPDLGVGCDLLANALGVSSTEVMTGLLAQMIGAQSSGGGLDENEVNFAINAVSGAGPRDELEAMLITQMAATHSAAMGQLKSMRNAELLHQLEAHERGANRLMRTFTAQMEALRKHRSKGRQKVEVRHVHVE